MSIEFDKKRGLAIGALFLLAMAAYMIGSELVMAGLGGAEGAAAPAIEQLLPGIALEIVNSLAVLGLAVLFYPVLAQSSRVAATVYAVARSMEAALLLVGSGLAVMVFMLRPGSPVTRTFLLGAREMLFQAAMVSLGFGSLFLCWVLLKHSGVPKWLSLIGLVGYGALLLSGALGLLGNKSAGMWLFIPGSVFEVGFPLWLFYKSLAKSSPVKSL